MCVYVYACRADEEEDAVDVKPFVRGKIMEAVSGW